MGLEALQIKEALQGKSTKNRVSTLWMEGRSYSETKEQHVV